VVSGANVRGRCSNRAPTENDTVTAKAMVVDDNEVSASVAPSFLIRI
jgi:hypothetical protein